MTAALKNTKAPTERIQALKTPSPTYECQLFPIAIYWAMDRNPRQDCLTGSCLSRIDIENLFARAGCNGHAARRVHGTRRGDDLTQCDNNDSTYRMPACVNC